MDLDFETREALKKKALEYMAQANPDWFVPHFHNAAFYMEKLIKSEGGEPRILIPAIYLHDIGYAGSFSGEATFAKSQDAKKGHMEVGARMAREMLEETGNFSSEEIDRIVYLIASHDNLEKIETHEAQLVFEADSLAGIDSDRAKPNFSKEDYRKYLEKFKERRAPLFKTETGKAFLAALLPKAEKYFD